MADDPKDELSERRGRRKPGTAKGRKHTGVVGPVSGAKAIAAAEKQERALNLRKAGATLTQIANEIGYATPSGAHQAIMAGLRTILPEKTRAEARKLEIARLDRLMMAHWQTALGGDKDASTIVLRCISLRAEIEGTKAPTELDIRVREGEPVRVEILELLNSETLEALKPFQDEMVRLSELRAGAIDVTASAE